MAILRDTGNDTYGRKINSRGTAEGECGPMTGNGGEVWKSVYINDWFAALGEWIAPHGMISPCEVYELSMEINIDHAQR